jgi:quinohemoprotein ethanol dehydrogenase
VLLDPVAESIGPRVAHDLTRCKNIVLKGDFAPLGMEPFDDILSEADVDAIHAYLIDQAWQGYKKQ